MLSSFPKPHPVLVEITFEGSYLHKISKVPISTKSDIDKKNIISYYREEATSSLAGFYAGLLSWWNWNLEILAFSERRKTGEPAENSWSKAITNNKLNPPMTPGRNRTQATLVRGECSYRHCANPADKSYFMR